MEAKGNDLGSLETVGKESSQMQFMFRDRSDCFLSDDGETQQHEGIWPQPDSNQRSPALARGE